MLKVQTRSSGDLPAIGDEINLRIAGVLVNVIHVGIARGRGGFEIGLGGQFIENRCQRNAPENPALTQGVFFDFGTIEVAP